MHKLIILFGQPPDLQVFMTGWQAFLGMAEQMPGLRRETVSQIQNLVFGDPKSRPFKIHELYFDDFPALESALASEAGQQAGQWLHQFTEGNFTLLTAPHLEALPVEFKKRKKRGRSS